MKIDNTKEKERGVLKEQIESRNCKERERPGRIRDFFLVFYLLGLLGLIQAVCREVFLHKSFQN